ncbi:MAG: hypothetical protein J0H91_11225 [Rhodospirillales bacterium]|nr:hypothetical protein [Rhodospirillales bacterium]
MMIPSFVPDWLPWWAALALLVPVVLYGLAFLAMPFSVLGLKGRLEAIDARLDEIQGEVRALSLRLPESAAGVGLAEHGLFAADRPPVRPPIPPASPSPAFPPSNSPLPASLPRLRPRPEREAAPPDLGPSNLGPSDLGPPDPSAAPARRPLRAEPRLEPRAAPRATPRLDWPR